MLNEQYFFRFYTFQVRRYSNDKLQTHVFLKPATRETNGKSKIANSNKSFESMTEYHTLGEF